DRLEAILRWLCDRAIARASFAGAEVKAMALAAVRATREAEARAPGTFGRERLPCERVGAKAFDGRTEAAVFPGDLPDDPASLLDGPGAEAVHFPRFRP